MLRTALLIVSALLTVAGAAILMMGYPFWPPFVWGAALLACVVFERWRYHKPGSTGGDWQPTGEKFIDPETGQEVEVLYNALTGERRYNQPR